MNAASILLLAAAVLGLVGAVSVVFTRDVTRLALGLGGFFLALAGFFALAGFGFLALAELFVYVGGVLVLVLFAIMLVHRGEPGRPSLESRHDMLAAVACAGLFAFIVFSLKGFAPSLSGGTASMDALASLLLGKMLVPFEAAGALLLAALVAVIAVGGGERE